MELGEDSEDIEIIVGRAEELDLSRSWYEPVELPQGFIALPFREPERAWWARATSSIPDKTVDLFFSDFSLDLMLHCAILGIDRQAAYMKMAMLSIADGSQSSVVWSDAGFVVRKQDDIERNDRSNWPVNVALRELGVDRSGCLDEFEALNLSAIMAQVDWPLAKR